MMDTVKNISLIETTLTRRGEGKSIDSPVRIITQYWTPQGALVIENDPTAISLTPEKRAAIRETIFAKLGENDKTRELIAAVETELL
jgi:hypothetical protein